MAHIKDVRFSHVGKREGCTCDKCGQWLTNIWTVEFQEGEKLNFGIDCYEKHILGKLNDYGKKEMKKVLKSIEEHDRLFNEIKSGENTKLVLKEWESYQYWQAYWKDKTIEEWKTWMINEVLPERKAKDDKEIGRFKKINF